MLRRCGLANVARVARAAAPVAIASSLFASMRSNASETAARSLAIAKDVNKLKRAHQQANPTDRKRIELEAWQHLNTLTQEEIENCEGQGIALVLNSWSYFAKFWEHGQDGPHGTNDPLAASASQ